MSKEQVQATQPRSPAAARAAERREKRRAKTDAETTLGVRFLSRIDPDEDFSDVDGDPRNSFALDNEDPTRHYHYATQADIETYTRGVVPYGIERATKDGVRTGQGIDGIAEGEPITKQGMILVSCDLAKWQKRNRFEYVKQMKTNEAMVRRRQRDVDLREREAFEDERAEVQKEMRG